MGKPFFICVIFLIGFFLCSCNKIKVVSCQTNAMLAVNQGKYKEAARFYQEAAALEPNVAEHHWNLGTVYVSMKQDDQVRKEIVILKEMRRSDLASQLLSLLQEPAEE